MKAIQIIGVSFVLLMLVTACDNPLSEPDGGTQPAGNVIIKIAGSDGRTVLPAAPVYSKFELTLQKEGDEPIEVEDTSGIEGAGVGVQLTEGSWTITLNAYQDVLRNGVPVLAAKGSAEIVVKKGDRSKTVSIPLYPLAIGETGGGQGVFSYEITLPPDVETATLSLKHSNGNAVVGHEDIDLTIEKNLSGRIALSAGYYDLTVIVTKNGQSAGTFESVHIYSGLESPLNLNLSGVAFADRIYIMGTLDGVRLGKVHITHDAAGTSPIETLELDGTPAVRSANWIVDIPSTYAGQTVYAVQEFHNGTSVLSSNVVTIGNVPINGVRGVALSLAPATPALFNVVPWYSELNASGGDSLAQVANNSIDNYWQSERYEDGSVWLEVDFDFDVTVNASRLIFYADSETGSVLISECRVQYWHDSDWVTLLNPKHHFEGSTDASVECGDFFTQITARKFRWLVPANSVEDAPALVEFGLYQTPDRGALSAAIPPAQNNHDVTLVSTDGEDVQRIKRWVTGTVKENYQTAIHAAQAVCDHLFSTPQEIANAQTALAGATTAFNNAKQRGNLDEIMVNEFSVQDGYAHQFVVTWLREPNYIYRLKMSTDNSGWSQIEEFPIIAGEAHMARHEVTGIGPNQTRYFTMQAYEMDEGEEVGGKNVAYSGKKETMGIPVLSPVNNGPSYRTISLSWTEAHMADAYRIVYTIAGDSTHATELAIDQLTPVAGGYAYSFQPNGYNDPQITGRKIDIEVKALNLALYKLSNCNEADVTTTSNPVETRLVGPALLNASATQAAFAYSIDLSWNKVEGAEGYYVFRRQFNRANTAQESAAIAYYVPDGSGALTVTGKGIGPAGGDTATTKASASFSGGRFTLTDEGMTDAEKNGTYSAYTANYKNQQSNLAMGGTYRYFVVPVVTEQTFSSIEFTYSNNNAAAYTIQDGDTNITYSNASSFEKTGSTFSFAQNVTATKGAYGSDITKIYVSGWNNPPPVTGSPQYTVWRRAYNNTANTSGWVQHRTNVAEQSIVDSGDAGVVYEYLVSISSSALPQDTSRFINECRAQQNAKGIPNMLGFMLEMVKLQGVSREPIQVNGVFGERLTMYNNSNQYYNKGIDGFTVYLMNRNIGTSWLDIGDIAPVGNGTEATQESLHLNIDNRLKVLRDYKHYFKLRSFVYNNGNKVYCPDPPYTYYNGTTTNMDGAFPETDYVKWGARQISAEEFAKIVTVYMGRGFQIVKSGSWLSTLAWAQGNASSNYGGGGYVRAQSNSGVNEWKWEFRNFKTDLQTRAGDWMTFISINGDIWIGSGGSQWPKEYGRAITGYNNNYLSITGPSDTNGMYTGVIWFGGNGTTDLTWGSTGSIHMMYPSGTAQQTVSHLRGRDTALPYHSSPNSYPHLDNEWR